jgi:hypothetical protein
MDNGQRDKISFVVMGMDTNKNVETLLWALVTPIQFIIG